MRSTNLIIAAGVALVVLYLSFASAQVLTGPATCNEAVSDCKKTCFGQNLWILNYTCVDKKNSQNAPTTVCVCSGYTQDKTWLPCPQESAQYLNNCPLPSGSFGAGNSAVAAAPGLIISLFLGAMVLAWHGE